MRISELNHKRVAIWGAGREGLAAVACLGRLTPGIPLTVLDDAPLNGSTLAKLAKHDNVKVLAGEAARQALGLFDVVIRSPGISIYRPDYLQAKEQGVVFTTGTRLWFGENPTAHTVCVTGTKGKSTTTSLVAHLLRAVGRKVVVGGNIGVPLLDTLPIAVQPDVWVIEMSSYQTADLDAGASVAVLLNLFPEHLDWHGGVSRYFADKIRLLRNTSQGIRIANLADEQSRELLDGMDGLLFFNNESGFHSSGGMIRFGDEEILPTASLRLRGDHNFSNICAALAAVDAVGVDWREAAKALPAFAGLPHRLFTLGTADGLMFVDDSIATVPEAAMAAVRSFKGHPITLLLGGFDRGLSYDELAAFVVNWPVHAVVTLPDSGTRIGRAIREATARVGSNRPPIVKDAPDLVEAVSIARSLSSPGGIVLLSPAAPSYGRYKDFEARGTAFAAAAGFGEEKCIGVATAFGGKEE